MAGVLGCPNLPQEPITDADGEAGSASRSGQAGIGCLFAASRSNGAFVGPLSGERSQKPACFDTTPLPPVFLLPFLLLETSCNPFLHLCQLSCMPACGRKQNGGVACAGNDVPSECINVQEQYSKPEEARFMESFESRHSDFGLTGRIAKLLGVTKPPLRMDSQVKYGEPLQIPAK